MVDFELAEHTAIRATWPTAIVTACMFHYGKALFKHWRDLGLLHGGGARIFRSFHFEFLL
jgi:hypothetical protein